MTDPAATPDPDPQGASPPTMADATDQPTGRHGMPAGTATILALLLGVSGFGAVWYSVGHEVPAAGSVAADPWADVDLTPPAWEPDPDAAAAIAAQSKARQAAAPAPDLPAVREVLGALSTFHAAVAEAKGDRRSVKVADTHAAWTQWARDAVRVMGIGGYAGFGEVVAQRFVDRLASGAVAEARALAGAFVEEARSVRLVDGQYRPTAGSETLLRLGFLRLWLLPIAEQHPMGELLSREERALLSRWRLTMHPMLPPERREAIARDLERLDPTFPVVEALGARFAQDRDWRRAERFYGLAADAAETAAHPGASRLRQNAAFAATMVKTGGRGLPAGM